MTLNRLKALNLLSECTGDAIWSVEYCRQRGVPESWLEDCADCFESGFDRDSQTVYVGDKAVNQYHGLRDVDLAAKLGEFLGVDVAALSALTLSRGHLVRSIREAVDEL